MESAGLERAVAFARENDQVAIWDYAERPWAIALYDAATKQLQPLSDVESATILNRDPLIRREWRKWNGKSQNHGSLILLDGEHVRRVINEVENERDADSGPEKPA